MPRWAEPRRHTVVVVVVRAAKVSKPLGVRLINIHIIHYLNYIH